MAQMAQRPQRPQRPQMTQMTQIGNTHIVHAVRPLKTSRPQDLKTSSPKPYCPFGTTLSSTRRPAVRNRWTAAWMSVAEMAR